MSAPSSNARGWRLALLFLLVAGSLLALLLAEPIPQDLAYHNFADKRAFFGIPNSFDVLSNLPFLFIGLAGVRFCAQAELGQMRLAWLIFFVGVTLVSAGSAYYHWNPNSATLVWDRLPMTAGFMGAFVALLGECVNAHFARALLAPAIAAGVASVAWWAWTDDLRPYAWVQFMPLLVLPVVLKLFGIPYSHRHYLVFALGWYVLAKITEFFDPGIFALSGGLVSGHSLKHLAAAGACYSILRMLQHRQPL